MMRLRWVCLQPVARRRGQGRRGRPDLPLVVPSPPGRRHAGRPRSATARRVASRVRRYTGEGHQSASRRPCVCSGSARYALTKWSCLAAGTFRPPALTTKVGDRVHRGQVLGRLCNTAVHRTAPAFPHHGKPVAGLNGLPFQFDTFTSPGTVTDENILFQGTATPISPADRVTGANSRSICRWSTSADHRAGATLAPGRSPDRPDSRRTPGH